MYTSREDDDGRERGDEPPRYPPKICQGQKVPHAHKDDALEYQYITSDVSNDFKSYLCSRCVAFDRKRGFVLERTFSEEKDNEN